MGVSDGRSPVAQRKGPHQPQRTPIFPALADNACLQAFVVQSLVEEGITYTN